MLFGLYTLFCRRDRNRRINLIALLLAFVSRSISFLNQLPEVSFIVKISEMSPPNFDQIGILNILKNI